MTDINQKLDDMHKDIKELRVDVKEHIQRISAAEVSIEWIKGHMKLLATFLVTLVSGIILFMLSSCGTTSTPTPGAIVRVDELRVKTELYESRLLVDNHGFIQDHGDPSCDSTLFTGLLSHPSTTLTDARDDSGRWYRRPLGSYPECHESGQSNSTVSRDMLLGVLWYAVHTDQQHIANDLWKYAVEHAFIMGKGSPGEVLLTGNMIWLTATAAGKISPVPWIVPPDNRSGFEAHLTVVQLLLKGELLGKLRVEDIDTLAKYADKNPKNGLFQYAVAKWRTGNMNPAVDILLDESLFPSDRNPDGSDRCEPWLWQRENQPHDWGPCLTTDPRYGILHTGADFLFVANLLLGD